MLIKRLSFLLAPVGIMLLIGCGHHNPFTGKVVLEDINARPIADTGYVDIFLKTILTTITDSSYIYIAKGLHHKKFVGLRVEIKNNIGAGIIDDAMNATSGFMENGVRISSIGEESDRLVQALADLYGLRTDRHFSNTPIGMAVFSLNDTIADLATTNYYRFKLFLEENSEDLYGEIFMNINTASNEVEFFEKDAEFRAPVIQALTK